MPAALVVTGMNGVMSIPRTRIGKMTEDGNWTLASCAFDEVEISTPAPDVAIIAYTVKQKVTMDGKLKAFSAADSSTWIRGADGWECHGHSETILSQQAAQTKEKRRSVMSAPLSYSTLLY